MRQDLRRLAAVDPLGQLREDSVVFRPSAWAALEAFGRAVVAVMAFLVPVGLGIVGAAGPDAGPWWLLLMGRLEFGVAILVAFVPMVRILFTRYIVDDEGVRVRSQILATQDQRVSWEKVTMLRHRRTVTDRLFGIARLDIVAYGRRGATLQLVGLRESAELRDFASRAMRRNCSVQALQRGD